MKALRIVLAGLAMGLLSGRGLAEDKPAAGKEEMMRKMEEAGRPGAPHKVLEGLAGSWDVNGRCWSEPGGTPTEQKGTATTRVIMNGRFLQEEFKGEFMGKTFQGLGIYGYDNLKQKYLNTWLDDMSTAIFVTEGTADASGKVLTFEGKMSDPMTGQKDKPMRGILRIVDANKHTFEMHDLSGGKDLKVMELAYTRRASNQRASN